MPVEILALVAALAEPSRRRGAAEALAASLGVEDLVIFILDPGVGVLLPAPGFPQTLPDGVAWKAFLAECSQTGEATAAELPYPSRDLRRRAHGVASDDGSILVLLGGRGPPASVAELRSLLPLLAAALHGELVAATAQAQVAVAQDAAAQARALAEALDRARRDLGTALNEARAARQQFAQFMQHLPGLAWIKDREGHYIYANEAFTQAFGISAELLRGSNDEQIFPPDVAAEFRTHDQQAIASESGAQGIEALTYGDGTVHHSVVSRFAIPGNDTTVAMVGGIAIDVTERQRAEDALHKQNKRLRILSEIAADLLAADDSKTMIHGLFEKVKEHLEVDAYFNYVTSDQEDTLLLSSYSGVPDEAVGNATRIPVGQAVCGMAALERSPISAAEIQQSDDPHLEVARSLGLRAYACNPLIAGRRVLGTLSFGSHTKERFDDDEVEFLHTLCHYVAAACERLRLISRLQEADRRKDEFLAILAHELRNPLAPISNAVDLIKITKHDAAQTEELREMMARQVKQMVRLIDDLMDASRISRGKLMLRMERISLASVVEAAVESASAQIENSSQQLVVCQTEEPLMLDADLTRLTQALVNLLNNASKYSPPDQQICLATERHGAQAVLRVKDNGQGIPPDRLAEIFKIFYQVDRSANLGHSGLGIGLTLVKSLVEMHGGTVEAHSEGLGRGSEFVIRLPLAATTTPVSAEPLPAAPRKSPRFRVLVVDDAEVVGDLFAQMLRAMGHDVEVASSGPEALELVKASRPHVVFSDISMPQMSGYELARRLRESADFQDLILVATTGYGQPEDRQKALQAGFNHHIIKPAQIDSLDALFATITTARH